MRIVLVISLFWASACANSSAVGRCDGEELAACRCASGALGEQVCESGVFGVCSCEAVGPMMCSPGASVACRCDDRSVGAQVCASGGIFEPCDCRGEVGPPDASFDARPFDARSSDAGPDSGRPAAAGSWTVDVQPTEIIQHPSDSVLFASVWGSSPSHANEVVAIDANNGQVLWGVYVGSDPGPLAISDDGEKLYVGLMGSGAVRRVDLVAQEANLEFAIGTTDRADVLFPGDMEVLPGSPNVLIVSTRRVGLSPDFGGVAVYDEGVRRPTMTRDHTGARLIEVASPERLYGFNSSSTEFGFRSLAVIPDGVEELQVTRDLFNGFNTDIVIDNGVVFGTDGAVVDPTVPRLLGTFDANGPIAVDTPNDRIYFMARGDFNDDSHLAVFEISTFRAIETFSVEETVGRGASQLLHYGPNRFVVLYRDRFEEQGTLVSFTVGL